MSAQISPDGMYYWDGAGWVSTLSHDGRSRWNGTAWVPVAGVPQPAAYQAGGPRVPTSWTQPLQYAVAAWYALSGLYLLTLPFWMGSTVSQVVNQSIQRQQELNPNATPLPANFADTMQGFVTGTLWVVAICGLAICAVIVIGALMRWTWMYYVVLVFLGLSAISLPFDLIGAVSASALSATSAYSLPGWTYWLSVATSIPATALFVWMLIAVIQRGPWGMKRAT